MIDFMYDTSNNITFPVDTRRVMLLIDGEYYRMDIDKSCDVIPSPDGRKLLDAEVTYMLYKEDCNDPVGYAIIRLFPESSEWAHNMASKMGYEEIPDDFFELEKIELNKEVRVKGIGTALLNYVFNDIIKFNQMQGKTIKILFERSNTDITLPFYQKFGARENETVNPHNKYRTYVRAETTPMIIDEPTTFGEIPKELADDFDYEKAGLLNPFTKPANRK